MNMYDIWRSENANGRMEFLGEIEAPSEEHALAWAKGQEECRDTCTISVELLESSEVQDIYDGGKDTCAQ